MVLLPNTARPNWETPDSTSLGITRYACARTLMPRNIAIASTAIVTSVPAAFFDSGALNAGTPSDTASTPVIAVQPLANAVSSKNVVNGREAAIAGPDAAIGTRPPVRYR